MVVANGVTYAAGVQAQTEAAAAVLVLPVGHSAFRRLCEAAAREGVDVHSLSLSLLMYGLGQGLTRRTAPTATPQVRAHDPAVEFSVVCLSCGRSRSDEREPRCTTCGGSWITAVR